MQTLQETSGLFQCWVFCTCTLLWNDPGPTEKPCDLPRERVPNQPKAGRGVPSPLCVAPSTWQDSARARKQPYLLAFLAESSQNTSPKLQGKKKKTNQPRSTGHSSGLSPNTDGKEDQVALAAGYMQPHQLALLQLHGWAVFLPARAELSWGGFHSLPPSARKHICQRSGV